MTSKIFPFQISVIKTIAGRTLRQYLESPTAYIVGVFFYGFIGILFTADFLRIGQASINGISHFTPWVLWFVVPALTMGLISEELRSGTFEPLASLPIEDSEIALGKYLGFAALSIILVAGMTVYPILVSFCTDYSKGLDGGATMGTLVGLLFLMWAFGAMGLFASSLSKNQVIAFILGALFCTFFLFVGQFFMLVPGPLSRFVEFIGTTSHMTTMSLGVFELGDIFYFLSLIIFFLFLTVVRLSLRRF